MTEPVSGSSSSTPPEDTTDTQEASQEPEEVTEDSEETETSTVTPEQQSRIDAFLGTSFAVNNPTSFVVTECQDKPDDVVQGVSHMEKEAKQKKDEEEKTQDTVTESVAPPPPPPEGSADLETKYDD